MRNSRDSELPFTAITPCALRKLSFIMGCSLVCGAISGCGGGDGELEVVAISGKVTCNGKPLGAGVGVQFVPVAAGANTPYVGKSATAVLQADGTFSLSTYGDGDGAVLGRHRIVILPATNESQEEDPEADEGGAEEEDEDEDEEGTPLPCPAPIELFVEITAESNVVNIEMADGGSVSTE